MEHQIITRAIDIYHIPNYLTYDESVNLWQELFQILTLKPKYDTSSSENAFEYKPIMIYGKQCIQNRSTFYCGEVDFKYSGSTLPAKAMPPCIEKLCQKLNIYLSQTFGISVQLNSCLINLYMDGTENIGHHSDGTGYKLGSSNMVVTLSLGTTRTFQLKCKGTGTTSDIPLANTDMVIMLGNSQKLTTHSILKDSSVTQPRMSLTFRHLI